MSWFPEAAGQGGAGQAAGWPETDLRPVACEEMDWGVEGPPQGPLPPGQPPLLAYNRLLPLSGLSPLGQGFHLCPEMLRWGMGEMV